MIKRVKAFTDGACRGNPGPGGWGVLLKYNNQEKRLYGADQYTTNNRMELTAAIMALQAIKPKCHVIMTTDSQYVRQGITQWVMKWQKQGWYTVDKKPVKNKQLWQTLLEAAAKHQVEWHWVKGHSNHIENDIADSLARKAIDELLENSNKSTL